MVRAAEAVRARLRLMSHRRMTARCSRLRLYGSVSLPLARRLRSSQKTVTVDEVDGRAPSRVASCYLLEPVLGWDCPAASNGHRRHSDLGELTARGELIPTTKADKTPAGPQ